MELLTNPNLWMETNVGTVAAAMTEHGVRTISLSGDRKGRPVFAMILVRGEGTQSILDAIDQAERALDAAGDES